MNNRLAALFDNPSAASLVRGKLPLLFHIAELESARGGKTRMEVGFLREKVLTAFLIHKFGAQNVDTATSVGQGEVNVTLFGFPVSIKTVTGAGAVKLKWTVDAKKSRELLSSYSPTCDVLLAQIKWDMPEQQISEGVHPGGLFYIPIEVQQKVVTLVGRNRYMKLPKPGTNPRGIEISKQGLAALLNDKDTKCIRIPWRRPPIDYDPYERWVKYWKEE